MNIASDQDPITVTQLYDVLLLPSLLSSSHPLQLKDEGFPENSLKFGSLTMESDRYITICSKPSTPSSSSETVLINLLTNEKQRMPSRIQIEAALVHPSEPFIATRCKSLDMLSSHLIVNPFPVESHLQILSLTDYSLVKSITLPEPVFYWRWISDDELGIVTTSTVYHWGLHGQDPPLSLIFTSHRFRSSKKEIFKIVRVLSGECADYQLSSVPWWLVVSLDWFDLFPWPNRAKWSIADVLLEERGLPKCSW